jgi:hypothetical protein
VLDGGVFVELPLEVVSSGVDSPAWSGGELEPSDDCDSLEMLTFRNDRVDLRRSSVRNFMLSLVDVLLESWVSRPNSKLSRIDFP